MKKCKYVKICANLEIEHNENEEYICPSCKEKEERVINILKDKKWNFPHELIPYLPTEYVKKINLKYLTSGKIDYYYFLKDFNNMKKNDGYLFLSGKISVSKRIYRQEYLFEMINQEIEDSSIISSLINKYNEEIEINFEENLEKKKKRLSFLEKITKDLSIKIEEIENNINKYEKEFLVYQNKNIFYKTYIHCLCLIIDEYKPKEKLENEKDSLFEFQLEYEKEILKIENIKNTIKKYELDGPLYLSKKELKESSYIKDVMKKHNIDENSGLKNIFKELNLYFNEIITRMYFK